MMAKRWKMFFRFFEMGLEKGVNHIIIPSKVNFGKNSFIELILTTSITQLIEIYINKEPVMPSKNDFAKF